MKRFKAIIFDMDGVIVDSEPLHERAFLEVFAEMGYAANHGVDFAAYYGRSDLELWVDFVAKHRPNQPLEELVEWKHSRLVKILREKQPIFPGLPELLEKCAARYRLAIASGSTHRVINEVLAMQNLRRLFLAVVSAEDVAEGKPAPDIFLRSAELLGVEARECCVIEDSAAGVAGALAAGMSVIAITNSLPAEKLARATSIVRGYAEIERLLIE
jgi:HAD superfamily hydrolase (TIGR01509 family)